MSTISSTPPSPFLNATSNGSTSSFLTSTDKTPMEKLVEAQKTKITDTQKGSYYYSEDYLRLKANEIHSRIITYKNLGLSSQYAQAQQEGQLVVGAYKAYVKAETSVSKLAGEEQGKIAGAAAAKAYMLNAQKQSFSAAPTLLTSA